MIHQGWHQNSQDNTDGELAQLKQSSLCTMSSTQWLHIPEFSKVPTCSNLNFLDVLYHESSSVFLSFFKKRFYLFIHDRHIERGRDIGRERSRLPAWSLMWDSIPGLWDHNLSWRQTLNRSATQVSLHLVFSWPDASERNRFYLFISGHLLGQCCSLPSTWSNEKEKLQWWQTGV